MRCTNIFSHCVDGVFTFCSVIWCRKAYILMPYNFPIFSFNCFFAKCHLRLQSEVIQVIVTFFFCVVVVLALTFDPLVFLELISVTCEVGGSKFLLLNVDFQLSYTEKTIVSSWNVTGTLVKDKFHCNVKSSLPGFQICPLGLCLYLMLISA